MFLRQRTRTRGVGGPPKKKSYLRRLHPRPLAEYAALNSPKDRGWRSLGHDFMGGLESPDSGCRMRQALLQGKKETEGRRKESHSSDRVADEMAPESQSLYYYYLLIDWLPN